LLKLIAGLYVPDSGSIFINKCNIGDYSLDQLRELISYVPQDSFLFNCSIAENIRLGNLDASHDEIVRVAQIADAHDFIMEMPDGYDYITGENGSKLSGGQKQRIALARALLKKTSIVLLDEATSALDQEMEKNIIVKLKEELKGRTVIMVTHRLSSGIFADNIVQLNNLKEEIVLV
jgi:ABC-type bacteriocin/lantibiotic exporter with double-glycine peptidase domain